MSSPMPDGNNKAVTGGPPIPRALKELKKTLKAIAAMREELPKISKHKT